MNKVIIYTAVYGNYDSRKYLRVKVPKVKYLFYTDRKTDLGGWKVINKTDNSLNYRLNARNIKINSHLLPEHDYSIWLDGSFQVRITDIAELLHTLNKHDMACYRHGSSKSKRNCAYDEAEACLTHNLDDRWIIRKQIEDYKDEGFPENFGLFSTGFIIRRNNEKVREFNEMWWEEVKNRSSRDQISQTYCIWKTGINVYAMRPGNIYSNNHIKHKKHIKKRIEYDK